MKVVFVCTGNTFTPTMLYKENYFIKASLYYGYDTTVYASQYAYENGKKILTTDESTDSLGYKLIRLPYKKHITNTITEKIRDAEQLIPSIISVSPDFIFINCPQVFNVTQLKNIKSVLPEVKIAMDFSTKYINSATNAVSKYLLHRTIYRRWLLKAIKYVDCVSYISPETKDFIQREYKINHPNLTENGLPAEVISPDKYKEYRKGIREELGIRDTEILFVHTGKMGKLKRTVELIESFRRNADTRFRLVIAGSLNDDIEKTVKNLIEHDSRIQFIGFLDGDKLTRLLCASDMYLQPGTISQTSQTAICCGSPIIFMKCPTNEELFCGNGFILTSIDELDKALQSISENPSQIVEMREKSFLLARAKLDYRKLFSDLLCTSGLVIR